MKRLFPKRVFARIYTPRERRDLALMTIGTGLVSFGDFVGVALVLPIIQALMTPDAPGPVAEAFGNLTGLTDTYAIVAWLVAIVVLAIVVKNLFALLFRWWTYGFSMRLSTENAGELFRRVLALPFPSFRSRTVGEYMRMLNEAITKTYSLFTLSFTALVSEAFTIVAVSIALFLIAPGVAFLAIAYFGVAGAILLLVLRRRQTQAGQLIIDVNVPMHRNFLLGLQGLREVRIYGKTDEVVSSYRGALNQSAAGARTVGYLGELPKYVMEIVFIIGITLIGAIALLTQPTADAVGSLATLVVAGTRVLPSVVRVQASVGGLRGAIPGVQLLLHERAWLDREGEMATSSSGPRYEPGLMRVDNVSYAYPDSDEPVLDGVSFELAPGGSVAIAGASGAGKSTLLDIITALQEPSGGAVTMAGRSIFDDVPAWHRSIGVVPQEVYLTDTSLAANIAFGDRPEHIDRDRVLEVIRHAELESVIEALPDGIDTELGERGVRLSGGQKQRVGIARALYRRPDVLILDEATSALDNETEHRFTQTIEKLRGDFALIVVAHRLSTVRNCDEVLYLEAGRVAARGSFEEVRQRNAHFASLVELGRLVDE